MSLSKAVQLIRGPKGLKFGLTRYPAGAAASATTIVTLIRDEIKLEDQEPKPKSSNSPRARRKPPALVSSTCFLLRYLRCGRAQAPGIGGRPSFRKRLPEDTSPTHTLDQQVETGTRSGVILELAAERRRLR